MSEEDYAQAAQLRDDIEALSGSLDPVHRHMLELITLLRSDSQVEQLKALAALGQYAESYLKQRSFRYVARLSWLHDTL